MPVTKTEKILSKLCDNTFLKLWSYPNLYTDEGKTNGKGDGKEFCDLFVVFKNHMLFFSDKNIKFNNKKSREVAWNRWYKKAVIKSAHQLYGAECFIKRFPNRIYLDRKCSKELPIDIHGNKQYNVHRIAVANGITDPIKQFYQDQRGSLLIKSQDIENKFAHLPFLIGQDELNNGFVHIFDDFTIQLILRELDTISDFVGYLQARKELLTKETILATGEEELLANYLSNINEKGEHSFNLSTNEGKEDIIFLTQGGWDRFTSSQEYQNKKQADRTSIRWDKIINDLGTSIPLDHEQFKDVELVLRKMASETRFERRLLCKQLFKDFEKKAAQHDKLFRLAFALNNKERAYIFLSLKNPFDVEYDKYRNVRANLLSAYCRVSKLKLPQMEEAVGIAIDAPTENTFTVDAAYFDFSEWSEKDEKKAQIEKEKFNLFDETTTNSGRASGKEYPESPT